MELTIVATIIITIISYSIIIPILDSFSSLVQSALNKKIFVWQLKMNIEEAKTQEEIEKISNNSSTTLSPAIGFELPEESNESDIYCNGKRQGNK